MALLNGLQTNQALSGRQIDKAAGALTQLETRPEIQGYRQVASQLGQERGAEDTGLEKLGKMTTAGVSGVYKNIAESEAQNMAHEQALGNMLNQQSSQIAQNGSQSLASMQSGALGGLTQQLAARGAPIGNGGAQQALTQAVASQDAQQNADSQAAQQFAAQQASSYGAMGAGMANSAAMQGGTAVGNIANDIVGRTAESDQSYNANIQTVLDKLAEAKSEKGAKDVKNVLALRGGEQKFLLGKGALGAKQGETAQKEHADERKSAREAEKNRTDYATVANADTVKAQAYFYHYHHPKTSSSEKSLQQQIPSIRAEIPKMVSEAKGSGQANNFNAYQAQAETALGKTYPPSLIRQVLQHWWQNRPAQGRKH